MLNPPLQTAKISHLQYLFSFPLSIPWKCFSWEEGKPSAPRPKFQWSWQLDAKFTVWNKMQWNVANRAAVAFSIFFSISAAQSCQRSFALLLILFFFLSGQRCTARQGDVGGTRRMDPMGTVNTSPTRKHWAALCVFQRWFLNFAERKWPREEACLFFQSLPPRVGTCFVCSERMAWKHFLLQKVKCSCLLGMCGILVEDFLQCHLAAKCLQVWFPWPVSSLDVLPVSHYSPDLKLNWQQWSRETWDYIQQPLVQK